MTVKNKHYERILAIAGLVLIIGGCLANIYGACVNVRFIHEPIDVLYYFRYVVLLGGGFASGYMFTKRLGRFNRLFAGVIYAMLAMILFWLFDFARAGLQTVFDTPPYPLGKILFMGTPLLVVLLVSLYAYLVQYRKKLSDVSPFVKVVSLAGFGLYQLEILLAGAYYFIIDGVTYDTTTIWMVAASFIINPLTITFLAYILFTKIKRFDRIFYASLVGAFYSLMTFVAWEFNTNPSQEATERSAISITVGSLLFIGCILWRIRRGIKR